jgi:Ca-activated chloride channel family protein
MRIRYTEYNGQPFRFQGDLDLGQFFEFVLAYGDEALRALRELEHDPEQSELLRQLLDEGLLEKVRGRFRLTPRAVNAMQRKALMEIFSYLKRGTREGHASEQRGAGGERIEGTVPFQFGDPVQEIDLPATLKNTLRRMVSEAGQAAGSGLLPLRVRFGDLERFETEARTSCSTVVLLDQSGSMARFGRFVSAKKCAMALIALVRQRFPHDTIDLVGFFSGAEPIAEERLPLLMPKPVTMFDPVIRMQVSLNQLDQAPPHFTNLHLGLMKARRILARRPGENRMIFIITDGQPTAHVQGDYAYLLYPPQQASHVATLKEAFLIARSGVRICTFALTDDYWDMDWLGFVDDLGRLTRGVTFHCASGDLGECVMESYLTGRRRKTFIA